MTTIAIRDGIVASDSLSTRGGCKLPGNETKLIRLKSGGVGAVSGNYAAGMKLLRWIDGDRTTEQPGGETSAIVVHPSGMIEVYEDGGMYREADDAPFMAYGSGMSFALAAIHMGASAERAVEIACLLDETSGGAVMTMKCALE